MKLSDQACKTAKPKEKAYKLSDGGGLYLEVTSKGAKLWRLKYRFLNKEKKLAIGPYPLITLAEARNYRDIAKKQLIEGNDPSALKQTKKQTRITEAGNTFASVALEWHKHKTSEWSDSNVVTVLDRLEKNIFPVIGKYPIKDLTHKMILDMANKIKERGAHELAKRSIQICNNIMQYAIITGRAERNTGFDVVYEYNFGFVDIGRSEEFYGAREPYLEKGFYKE